MLPKRGRSKITRRIAESIAKKLEAKFKPGTKHKHAVVWFEGKTVATFGIRRDAKSPHGHIPSQIGVSATDAMKLAACTMSRDEYIEHARKKGRLA